MPREFHKWLEDCVRDARNNKGLTDNEILLELMNVAREILIKIISEQSSGKEKS